MDRFDAIVVGAGSAGCVVAARLAETGARTLLLEAGPDRRARPAADLLDAWQLPPGDENSEAGYRDWGYRAEPNAHGQAPRLRRGRMVGGTSHLTRFALRGSPADFDEWEALGNPGWDWDAVLPAFRSLESDAEFGADPWHGDDGPIPITRYPDLAPAPTHQAAREALLVGGFADVPDHNRPGSVGVGPMPMSSRDGARVTTAAAYLPIGDTSANLTIRPDAVVASLALSGNDVVGARLLDGSVIEGDRVVLCAGVYGSPPILMRSGIGPAAELRRLGIPVAVNLLGVGANLADHPAVDLDLPNDGAARDRPVLHTVATLHSEARSAEDAPDLMLWLSDPTPLADPWFGVDIVLLKPRSRGTVRLRSADPVEPPSIELPGLTDGTDIERLADGYRHAREVFGLAPVTPAELREYVRGHAYSLPHMVGTCAMGPDPGLGAVVDPAGRVHGVNGVYVADASVIPIAPSGFTQLIVIMLAERIVAQLAGAPLIRA